ncbi:hypothetical protein B9Z55_021305 [Caenorhabditis nigoni]|nr:hypothetical protein B9Z55_021305 [Caenorhabditis nigoni]
MKNSYAIFFIFLNVFILLFLIILLKNILGREYYFSEILENQYCVTYNYLEATESFRESDGLEPISLATHATSDMLKTLENMPKMWNSPISVAIFVDEKTQKSLDYLQNLHNCDKEFQRKMTIHVAFRKSAFQKRCPPLLRPKNSETSCFEFLSHQKSYRDRIPSFFGLYPFGLMRNIARKGAKSDIHFVMDSDMIVSEGMDQKIKRIANQMLDGKLKNVILVRRFENVVGTEIPRNVKDLEESMRNNITFEFHHKYFFKGHKIPNLTFWRTQSQDNLPVSTWNEPYSNPDWEPQPILHRNSPLGPDYVPSRVKTMCSVIYKLCRAGYNFHVISHVFNVQEGIKLDNTVYGNAIAHHQYTYARDKVQERFTKEMDWKYPGTKEKCGHFVF